MGLDAPRARFLRGRAENIAAAAAGRFQHPEIKKKRNDEWKNRGEIKESRAKNKQFACVKDNIPTNIFFYYRHGSSSKVFSLFSLYDLFFEFFKYIEKRRCRAPRHLKLSSERVKK